MNQGLQRPKKVEEVIERTMRRLNALFQKIRSDKELDISKTAFIPLARRGVGILPRFDRKEPHEEKLVKILNEFGYYEKYSLFPSIRELSKCKTVIVFDDVCETGENLLKYKNHLVHLAEKLDESDPLYKNDIRTAALIIKEDEKRDFRIDYPGEYLSEEEYEKRVLELYMVIASRGLILDPDHMLIEVCFSAKKDFFDVWNKLEKIADSSFCDLIEDGIEFLNPRRKELAFYVRKNKKKNLENLGLNFSDFIADIDIAKFRMVFDLELDVSGSTKQVLTTGFEAVPIVNPVVRDFSVDACLNSWDHPNRFCKKSILTQERCSAVFLRENLYHPRDDCIIGNLVRQFKDYFLGQIQSEFEGTKFTDKWLHQERLEEYGRNIQSLW